MTSPVRPVPPSVARRSAPRRPLLQACLATVAASLVWSGSAFGACFFPISGEFQGVVEGTRVNLPMLAQASESMTPATSSQSFTWSASSGAVLFSNGSDTLSGSAPWVFLDGLWFAETMEQPYIGLGTAGSVQINVSSPDCVGTDAVFNVFVQPLVNAAANAVLGTQQAMAGESVSLTVKATHGNGKGGTLDAVNVPFTFMVGSGPGTLSGGSPTQQKIYTDGLGFAEVVLDVAGGAIAGQTITVTANAPGYPTVPFTVNVFEPAPFGQIEIVSGNDQAIDALATSEPIVLQTTGTNGPLGGYSLFLTVVSGDAVIAESGSGTHLSEDLEEDAIHEFSLIAGATAGPVVVQIDGDGFAPAYVYANVQPSAPPIPMETVGGDGQAGVIGSVLPQALRVRLPPPQTPAAAGGAKTLPTVLFSVTSGQGRFTQNNGAQLDVVPDPVTGEAAAQLRLGNEIGDLLVTATAPGYTPASFNLKALAPGSDVVLTPVSGPDSGQPNSESAPLVVELTRGGTPLANASVHWEVFSGDATVTSSDTQTDGNGRAQSTALFGSSSGLVVIRASHTATTQQGTTYVVSADFQIMVGSAGASIQVVSGNGQTGSVGSLLDQPMVFRVVQADGTPIPEAILAFSASGPGTMLSSSGVTDDQGQAGVRLRFGNTPGVVTVNASLSGGTATASATATSFAPSLTIRSGNQQSGVPGSELAEPLVVRLTQAASAMAKGLAGVAVNWQVVCGNGQLQSPTTATDANGESANRLTLGTTPGCNEVTASVAGVGSVSFTANGGVPAGAVIEIVAGNGQALVPLEDSSPLQVRVRTASGEPVPGAIVTFSADRPEATLTPGEATTDANGLASSIVRIGLPVGVRVLAKLRDAPDLGGVEFVLNAGVVNTEGLAPGEVGVADAIDSACPQLAGMSNLTPQQQDLLARCSELVVNAEDDPDDVGRALGEMLADEATSQNNAALTAANNQLDNLKARFAALRAGARGVDLAGLNVLVPGGALSFGLLPSAIVLGAGEPPEEVGSDFSRWGFFATGTIGRGERDPDTYDPGFEYDSYDITAGIDYRFTESWILGGALGFNRNNTDLPDDRGGMDAKGWTVSGYASYFDASAWYADAVLSWGRNNFDLERRLNYGIDGLAGGRTLVDQVASASPDGDRTSFSLAVGRDFNRGAWTFGPYLRTTYSKLDFDAYTETMSNPSAPGAGLALAVDARELKSLQGVVGGKLSYAVSTSWGILLPNAQIEWVREFEDDPELLVTRFAYDPTQTPILVESERIDNDYFNLGVGLSGVFANGRSAYVYYEHVAGQDRMSSDSLAIGVRIEF
jgi:outer membrane autotransporter protein